MQKYPITYSDNFYEAPDDLFYRGLALLTVSDYGNVAFVSTNGSDVRGKKGRIDRPFKTIQKALESLGNAGVVMGTVIVNAGTYTENIYSPASAFNEVTIALQGSVTVNGSVYINGRLNLVSDGFAVWNGIIWATNALRVRGLLKINCGSDWSGVVAGNIYPTSAGVYVSPGGTTYIIENIGEITASYANGFLLRADLDASNKATSVIRNIGKITNTGQVMAVVRNVRLENIGLVESTTSSIDNITETNINAVNVNFKSVGNNFHFRGRSSSFYHCTLESTAGCNFQDMWNSTLILKNCKLRSALSYHLSQQNQTMAKLHVHGCEFNKADIINPATAGIGITDYQAGYNATSIELTF